MLVIRFLRVGKKNQPVFKIVVTEKGRPPKSGKFVEQVGFYNPLTKEKVLKKERIKYWMSVGAKPSNTVHNLLVKEKILTGEKIPVHKKSKKLKKKAEEPVQEVEKEGKPAKEAKQEVKTEEKPLEKEKGGEKPPEKAEKEEKEEKIKKEKSEEKK